MAYRKSWSPFRYHPGRRVPCAVDVSTFRCPHCTGPCMEYPTAYYVVPLCLDCGAVMTPSGDTTEFAVVDGRIVTRSPTSSTETVALPTLTPSLTLPWREAPSTTVRGRVRTRTPRTRAARTRATDEGHHPSPEPTTTTTQTPRTTTTTADSEWIAQWLKIADGVERAHRAERVSSGMGLRRNVLAAKLWSAAADWPLDERRSAVYRLIAADRGTPEEEEFYTELYVSLYGQPPAQIQTERLVALCLTADVPVWLHGPAGVGKTYLTRRLAEERGWQYLRFQGSRDRTIDDVVGGWGYHPDQGTVFRYGALALAVRDGGLLHLDEASALPHETTFELHAVLEGRDLVILKNGGERIRRHPLFRIVANDNTVGVGEHVAYVGTGAVNAAFRDRWAYVRMSPLPEAEVQRIMASTITESV